MKIDCIIGIDPGAKGGIATWRPNHQTKVIKMPKEIGELHEYIEYIKGISSPIIFLEKLQLWMGDVTNPDGSMNPKIFQLQKMFQNYEQLKAILTVEKIPFALVSPIEWQKILKLRLPKENKKDRKNRYVKIAGSYYPEIRTTLWNADALLLVRFGRVMLQNNPKWVIDRIPSYLHNTLF